ncbi:MAG: DNA mismatch repair protein MutS [Candidatus Latescibacteria bacterium]|nr:DNA mismatch repair protein MutS [bacterium]MBD3424532.1 DNA mismatch repair protein MutS [Candidatus Latescibacterota bacterium]
MSAKNLTPLMAQYHKLKKKQSDGILFFQVGDFYETFYDDAEEVSRILNIALTSRDKKNPVPLAGVPIHAKDAYIAKLLNAGRKVIICDQVEDASQARGLVRREVTDVITPGTTLSPSTLQNKQKNYIAAVTESDENRMGLALLDLSTGEFTAGEESIDYIDNLLSVTNVREVIHPENCSSAREMIISGKPFCSISETAPYSFNYDKAREALIDHFGTETLAGFGVEDKNMAVSAAGALLSHVKSLRRDKLEHITGIRLIRPDNKLFLDRETVRNLELFEPIRGDSPDVTLIRHIDHTLTAGGGRMLREWLKSPSREIALIRKRLDAVTALVSDQSMLRELRELLRKFPDMERIVSRISTGRVLPKELLQLLESLKRLPGITAAADGTAAELIQEQNARLRAPVKAEEIIESGIREDCSPNLRDGGVIRKGFDRELDQLIESSEEGKAWIARLQEKERKNTGISTLKVGYNKVFGYYIEVSRTHAEKIPEHYIEKQTLVSSRRYITEALKEKENSVLSAEARRIEYEKKIYHEICGEISRCSARLQEIAEAVSILDLISSLAYLALEREYARPEIDDSDRLVITGGRHPVVEIISEKPFIPNDIKLIPSKRQVLIITGPNMGGKSTIIRQTALISILAHMGSYVPASRAEIGVMDRIFTRVGSSDNLARGQSTFLVEMTETANILHNCTSRSLVLLDEIGRGTSTSDGLSLAQAVTEFLVSSQNGNPKTLFATHYHQLTSLASRYPRIKNMRVATREWNDRIIFLYKLLEGKSDQSYGIHVAKLAGLPEEVIERAREILSSGVHQNPRELSSPSRKKQAVLFPSGDRIREILRDTDLNRITPIEALNILVELQKLAEEK